ANYRVCYFSVRVVGRNGCTYEFSLTSDHNAHSVMTIRRRSSNSLGSGPERSAHPCHPDGTEMDEGTMRVLIVDDEPLAQTALANVLSARSDVEHFDSANDAVEALEKLATDSYDVLLLDINMLNVSGTELVDQLRKRHFPLPSI